MYVILTSLSELAYCLISSTRETFSWLICLTWSRSSSSSNSWSNVLGNPPLNVYSINFRRKRSNYERVHDAWFKICTCLFKISLQSKESCFTTNMSSLYFFPKCYNQYHVLDIRIYRANVLPSPPLPSQLHKGRRGGGGGIGESEW